MGRPWVVSLTREYRGRRGKQVLRRLCLKLVLVLQATLQQPHTWWPHCFSEYPNSGESLAMDSSSYDGHLDHLMLQTRLGRLILVWLRPLSFGDVDVVCSGVLQKYASLYETRIERCPVLPLTRWREVHLNRILWLQHLKSVSCGCVKRTFCRRSNFAWHLCSQLTLDDMTDYHHALEAVSPPFPHQCLSKLQFHFLKAREYFFPDDVCASSRWTMLLLGLQ